MKAVSIDFVLRRTWKGVWMVAAVVVLGLLIWHAIRSATLLDDIRTLDDKLSASQFELKKADQKAKANPRSASIRTANKALSVDLNKPFAALENMSVPGVLLVGASFDVSNDGLRVEYALESMSKAAEVTDYLNMGYDTRPWVMENVTSNVGLPAVNGTPISAAKGIWSVKLERLE